MKPRAKQPQPEWDGDHWRQRCAWCEKAIHDDDEVFAIERRLREEAVLEREPGTIQPVFLPQTGKILPLIVVAADSPAKQEGKDAVFQVCSKLCGQSLKETLGKEMGDS